MLETWVWVWGQEDPLEKAMATHSSIPAWEIPWPEEPGGVQAMGSKSQTRLNNWTTTTTQEDHTRWRTEQWKRVCGKSAYQFVLLWQLLPHLSQFFTQFPKIWHKRVKKPRKTEYSKGLTINKTEGRTEQKLGRGFWRSDLNSTRFFQKTKPNPTTSLGSFIEGRSCLGHYETGSKSHTSIL